MLYRKKWLIVCLAVAILIGFNIHNIYGYLKETSTRFFYDSTVNLTLDNTMGEGVYSVQSQEDVDVFNMYYQESMDVKINALVSTSVVSETPLIIYNPYGTNTSSFYFSFFANEKYDVEYSIHATDESIDDFTKKSVVNKISEGVYATQLIGFVSGFEHEVHIVIKERENIISEHSYTIHMPDSASEVQTKLYATTLQEGQQLSNGLYAVFGLDKSFNSNVYLYDNQGVLRSELPLMSYRSERLIFTDDTLIYSYRKSGLMEVNQWGRIVDFYDFDGYEQHHDFIYDQNNETFLILANKVGEETIEDYVISVDKNTKEVKEVADMKVLLPSLYAQASSPSGGNTYGTDELDWIHLNSLSLEGNNLVVSAREISTIIKLSNIYTSATIEYMIANESIYEDSEYNTYLLKKEDDFISQAGQHTVTYALDSSLPQSQYYLYMFNNNFTSSRTRDDLDWSAIEGAGSYTEGAYSLYYKYLVDESKNTYELVERIEIPYSSIVSSAQIYELDHIITSSGKATCFNEYDSDGTLIAQFEYDAKKYAYRVFKYTFEDIYFTS